MTDDLSGLVIENKGQLKAVRNILTSKADVRANRILKRCQKR